MAELRQMPSSLNDACRTIDILLEALEQCGAPFSTPPGSVAQCQAAISAEFQRRMDIAGEALRSAVGTAPAANETRTNPKSKD